VEQPEPTTTIRISPLQDEGANDTPQ